MEISLNFIEKYIHYKENFNIYFFPDNNFGGGSFRYPSNIYT